MTLTPSQESALDLVTTPQHENSLSFGDNDYFSVALCYPYCLAYFILFYVLEFRLMKIILMLQDHNIHPRVLIVLLLHIVAYLSCEFLDC